jgi:hypothetical protein
VNKINKKDQPYIRKVFLSMFDKSKKIGLLNKNIDNLNRALTESNVLELLYIMGSKKEIIKRNLLAGFVRGVGIGIGVTIISAVIVLLLQRIVMWNLPGISQYIADIVEIVQKNI